MMVVVTEVGDGVNTLFWKDNWLDGKSIQSLAPSLSASVSRRRANRRSVKDALDNDLWLEDIQGEITIDVLWEYLELWDIINVIELQQGIPNKHI